MSISDVHACLRERQDPSIHGSTVSALPIAAIAVALSRTYSFLSCPSSCLGRRGSTDVWLGLPFHRAYLRIRAKAVHRSTHILTSSHFLDAYAVRCCDRCICTPLGPLISPLQSSMFDQSGPQRHINPDALAICSRRYIVMSVVILTARRQKLVYVQGDARLPTCCCGGSLNETKVAGLPRITVILVDDDNDTGVQTMQAPFFHSQSCYRWAKARRARQVSVCHRALPRSIFFAVSFSV